MPNPLIRVLKMRDHLSDEETQALIELIRQVKEVGPDKDIVREGERPSDSTLVLDGFACRYKVLASGKRQILAVHVPGDFVDLDSFLQKTMDHGIATLTTCQVALVSHEGLREITESHPHLARLLWLGTVIDTAILRQWVIGTGRQSALSRTAHLLCELFVRLRAAGLAENDSFQLPITQAELGDALGLSTVHVNRVIQQLRRSELITWRGSLLRIEDWARLVAEAEFDESYLSLEAEPR